MLSLRVLLLLLITQLLNASFVLQVGTDDEQCFVIRAPPNSLISGNFDVLEDNLSPDPVSVKILEGSNMNTLYVSERGVSEDLFRVQVRDGGRLYVCVQNGIDHESEDELDRKVGIDIRVSSLPKEDSATQRLLNAAEQLSYKILDLQNHQDYMRNREAAHRQVTEETFTYVVRWSLLEFAVLLGVAVAQIIALRVFFERKRYI